MPASTQEKSNFRKFTDKFTEVSVKIGNEVHLRSLRDAFATIMPMYILAGFATLINSLILPYLFKGATLAKCKCSVLPSLTEP